MKATTFVLRLFCQRNANEHGTVYLALSDVALAIRKGSDLDQWDGTYSGSQTLARESVRQLLEAGTIVPISSGRYRLASFDEPPEDPHDDFRDPVPECRDRCGSPYDPGLPPGI